jgi:ABC-type Fe3+ transport system permease subunit
MGLWLFLGILGSYTLIDLLASLQITYKEKEWKFLAILPLIFPSLHVAYGVGSLVGVVKVIGCVLFPHHKSDNSPN